MRCITPVKIKNPKNDARDDFIYVPCGKCAFCLQRRQGEWIFRIKKEQRFSNNARFITLTYDEEFITITDNGEYTLNRIHLQQFIKRFRKRLADKGFKYKVRFYAVGEYGTSNNRPHYHLILFNVPSNCDEFVTLSWMKGYTYTGEVTTDSIAYVTKYLINVDEVNYEGKQRPFSTMSLKPGIGNKYLDNSDHIKKNLIDYVVDNGYKKKMPRYYRDKIFDEDEKAILQYRSDMAQKFDYSKQMEDLRKKGYDPETELELRIKAKHDKIFKSSNKNRKI